MDFLDFLENIMLSEKVLVAILLTSVLLGFMAAVLGVMHKEYNLIFAPIFFPIAAYVFWVCIILFICFLLLCWKGLIFLIT